MAYKVRDLIVTVMPSKLAGRIGDCEQTSGGCDATSGGCDAGTGGTTGSCSSENECGAGGVIGEGCDFSDELLDPLNRVIDPAYMGELRTLVRHAVAQARSADRQAVDAELAPKTQADLELLEGHLSGALDELRGAKEQLGGR